MTADDAMDSVVDFMDNPGSHAAGILTGLEPLDSRLGPMLPGDLIGLAGRPGSGKSAEAAVIGMNVSLTGVGVIEIHAEMTVQQAWRRRLTSMAFTLYGSEAPAYSAIRRRTITYDQRKMLDAAREKLRGIPLMAVKRTGMTLGQLWALVARQKALWAKQGIVLGLVTIDHAGLITSGMDHRSRVDEQTAVSNGLKIGAGDHDVATMALLQLNRAVEARDDKRPTLPDLRDSGSWEQDCDTVIGAYREAYYAAREKEPPDKTVKEQATWADWDQRRRSPWIENILLKVREGDISTAKLWGHMATNAILGSEPSSFGGFL
jgi:replicative DNA helicase